MYIEHKGKVHLVIKTGKPKSLAKATPQEVARGKARRRIEEILEERETRLDRELGW